MESKALSLERVFMELRNTGLEGAMEMKRF
jgi:hypothetical protein